MALLLCRSRVCYARMPFERKGAGDRDKAADLLSTMLAVTSSFDMAGLRADASQLLASV